MRKELLVYGLKPLSKYFRWGDKNDNKTRKLWLVKEVKETKNWFKVTLYRGYKFKGCNDVVVIEEKTVPLSKRYLKSIEKAIETHTLDNNFRFENMSDLISWLMKNFLL